jgi:hypothetical protein
MKNVLAWVKGHLVVVIAAVIAIAALPVLLFVSTGMNAALREEVQEDVSSQQRSLQQISVQYAAEPLDPSRPAESFSAAPNEATTLAMKRVIEARDAAATEVLLAAIERNRAGKTPMLDGLFPAPAPAETTAKRQAAARAWVRAHERLLDRVNAGGPLDPETLAIRLETRQAQEQEKIGVDQMTPEDEESIRETLVDFRAQQLTTRAEDVAFCATMDTFVNVSEPQTAELPTLEEIWDWQHRLWIHEDVLLSASAANTDPETGLAMPPGDRPVKRLIAVETLPWSYTVEGAEAEATGRGERRGARGRGMDDGFGGGGATASVGSLAQEIRPDLEASITGRAGWPYKANPLYDARYVYVTAILDGAGIDRFIESIEAQNFMSVIDLDLRAIEPGAGLAEGYAYGGGSLVRAEMTIETLWLREWLGELAPDGVREAMGLPPRETATDTQAAPGEGPADGRG